MKMTRAFVRASKIFVLGILSTIVGLSAYLGTAQAAASPGTNGSWLTNGNSLPQALQNSSAVTNNGYVYVVGGQTSVGTRVNTVYYAPINTDGSVGSWVTSTHTLPQALSYGTAVVYNNYLYFMGGNDGTNNVDTVYYAPINTDGSVGSWVTSPNTLPLTLSNATAQVDNGYIYVIGGTSGGVYQSALNYTKINSDGSLQGWTNTTGIPQALVLPSSFIYNHYFYIVGGYQTSATASTNIYYAPINANGTLGTWHTNTTGLTKGVYAAAVSFYNGYVFVSGGYNDVSGPIANVYSAPVSTSGSVGTFTASSNALPVADTYAADVTYNGFSYVIGGSDNTATIYYSQLTGFSAPSLSPITTNVTVNGSTVVNVVSGVSGNPDPNSVTIVSGPSHGTAVDPPGTITYTPNAGYVGTDSLTYSVCSLDDESLCAQGTLNFTILASASAPATGFGAPTSRSLPTLVVSLSVLLVLVGASFLRRHNAVSTK